MLGDGLEGSALARAWAAGQSDAVDRVFLVFHELAADALEAEGGGCL